MILGRSITLWLALVAAVLNVAVVVFGIRLEDVQVAALNAAALALLGFVANERDPTTAPTFALTTRAPSIPSSSVGARASQPAGEATTAGGGAGQGQTAGGGSDLPGVPS